VELLNAHANHRFHALVDLPLWVPTPRNRRAREALAHLENVVYGIIRERRGRSGDADPKGGWAAGSPPGDANAASPGSQGNTGVTHAGRSQKDLLGMLLDARYDDGSEMPEKQVRDEVMTIFMAGHETTATAMAWTLALLHENPSATERLRGEISSVIGERKPAFADLPRLPWLKQCLEESMRLRPPVWSYSRTALGPDRLGDTDIPKGALILLCNYAMHRDPRFWSDPEAFRPERFAPEEAKKRPAYAYFPFGGGPRICIGNGMAMMEGQLVLACLLRAFDFRLAEGRAPEMNPLVTLRPKGGMWMTPASVRAPVTA
jgi:cytochrome P450